MLEFTAIIYNIYPLERRRKYFTYAETSNIYRFFVKYSISRYLQLKSLLRRLLDNIVFSLKLAI